MKDFITRYETMKIDGAEAFYDGAIIGELIRCKDCKHNNGTADFVSCLYVGEMYAKTGENYCSLAEKKTD